MTIYRAEQQAPLKTGVIHNYRGRWNSSFYLEAGVTTNNAHRRYTGSSIDRSLSYQDVPTVLKTVVAYRSRINRERLMYENVPICKKR